MKNLKALFLIIAIFLIASCGEDIIDSINNGSEDDGGCLYQEGAEISFEPKCVVAEEAACEDKCNENDGETFKKDCEFLGEGTDCSSEAALKFLSK